LSSASTGLVSGSTRSRGTVRGRGQVCAAAEWLRRPRDVGAAGITEMASPGPGLQPGPGGARLCSGRSREHRDRQRERARRGSARHPSPGHSASQWQRDHLASSGALSAAAR
jgi:hypothetical protein